MKERYLSKEEFYKAMKSKMTEYEGRGEVAKYIDVIKQVFKKQEEYFERKVIRPYIVEQEGKEVLAIEVAENVGNEELEQIKKEVNFMVKIEKMLGNHLV